MKRRKEGSAAAAALVGGLACYYYLANLHHLHLLLLDVALRPLWSGIIYKGKHMMETHD